MAGLWMRRFLSPVTAWGPAGAFAMFFPFGRSRHTILTGLLTLAATGDGIEALSKRCRLGATGALLALAIFASTPDVHNPYFASWQKARWESAMRQMDEAVPAGTTLLAGSETTEMLRLRLMPRDQRRVRTGKRQTLVCGLRRRQSGRRSGRREVRFGSLMRGSTWAGSGRVENNWV